ncbi:MULTISPECIES: Lrp/AsnC family transcriptional regulator [Pseudomonas]|jgi:DNA-binding Lrp family transcriptional regulator|uniref:ArsR family transcriptional regulator n=1 Tax=Pseudomonas oryzihabitans TaxID=47885 RepID=A0A0U4WGI4_9PSED|nr:MULTISPECIES: Lrp/AsnC family transcriptional regulator [Pseudomonas]ALZ84338.1 ArsR family transcriptional regulator [Pseudomonas oryzihabitans]WCE09158.1 Lrp/AsnC family transcriptional regulator [Pseudomonas sp. JBR1]HAC69437.1 Lrp/AsnC family transcriptional regulator [Pseudomonas sp.]
MAGLDRIDLRILNALSADGRLSWRDLAQKIGLSLTPTLRRVKRLEEERYIQGYHAQLDETRLAGSVSVFVSVRLEKQSTDYLRAFEGEIVKAPQVMSCFQMTGDADYVLRVVVQDLAAYQRFLAEVLTCIPGVASVTSAFSLKAVLLRPAPPL